MERHDMSLADYPGVTPFTDRHGKQRWRFREKGRGGKQRNLPGNPGEQRFELAYQAALRGEKPPTAQVKVIPGATLPKSFGAAARKLEATTKWKRYDEATRKKNTHLLEIFLESRIVEEDATTWRDAPIPATKRAYLKEYLSRFDATPAKRKHMLVAIRKLISVAFDEDWIELDPTTRLDEPVQYKGWRAWTPEIMEKFEKRWPIGSAARTCYGLALWLGNRRGDIAALSWSDLVTRRVIIDGETIELEAFAFTQTKNRNRNGGKNVFIPITPMLAEILAPLDRSTPAVLMNAYGEPFSAKSLTGMMAHWNKLAANPPGYTLHGLRKTLGGMLATGEATTRQLMEVLGHDDIEHAELYSRSAEQARLAHAGMQKVVKLVRG
jgi:integrase